MKRLLHKLGEAIERLEPFTGMETARMLHDELSRMPTEDLESAWRLGRPPIVALIGGTGVGKSSLFNLLVGQDFSPVAVERACTTRPVIALPAFAKPCVAALLEEAGLILELQASEAVLIDTPDIDGYLLEHHASARRVIEQADVLVYVTNPNKRSNEAVWRTLREWGSRKRWFFVLNQGDMLEEPAAAKSEWAAQLRAGGFPASDADILVTSAREPDLMDFNALHRRIFSQRTVEWLETMRRDAWLSRLLYALPPGHLEALRHVAEPLREKLSTLDGRIQACIDREWPDICAQSGRQQALIEELIWRELTRAKTGLLAPYIRLRNVFSGGGMLTRLLSPWCPSGSNGRGIRQTPGWKWLPDGAERLNAGLQAIRAGICREAQDAGLTLPETDTEVPFPGHSALIAEEDMEALTLRNARSAANFFWRVTAHLLPLAVTAFSFWRMMADYYARAVFQPGALSSYLFMLVLTLLPGLWMLRERVASRAGSICRRELKQMISLAVRKEMLQPLQEEVRHLETASQTLHDLRTETLAQRNLERARRFPGEMGLSGND